VNDEIAGAFGACYFLLIERLQSETMAPRTVRSCTVVAERCADARCIGTSRQA